MGTPTRKIILLETTGQFAKQVTHVFGTRFGITEARDRQKAAKLIESDTQVEVMIVGSMMPARAAIELLEQVREKRPDVRRALVAEYSNLSHIVAALHGGTVQCLIQNPTTDAQLLIAIYPEVAQRAGARSRKSA